MPTLAEMVEYLGWLTIVALLALYLRLRQQGLHRVYRVFAAYLLFRAACIFTLAVLPPLWYLSSSRPYVPFGNNVYAWGWLLTTPVLWVLHILVVLELYSLVFRNYRGIASMGRWATFAGLGIAILLSSLTLPADLSRAGEPFPILRAFVAVTRGVDSSLVLFLLFISAFLTWFPVPLCRNVVLYSMVYAVYFITTSLAELLRNLSGSAAWGLTSILLAGADLVCLAVWILFLNREGESKRVVVRHTWAPQREEILIQQLAAINSTLLRSGRR